MKKQELYKLFNVKSNLLDEIVCKELSMTREQLFLLDEIDDKFLKNIKKQVKRFQRGVPIEYIFGRANFYGLDFFVDKRALIPRNDTEIMVKEVLKEAKKYDNITLIDVGTGSGNIAISCVKNSSSLKKCFAIDKSKKALEIAKANVEKYNLQDKITLLKGDLLKPILTLPQGGEMYEGQEWIFITANLPYIKNDDFENMSPETLTYEPKMALFGGENTGFELYEKLIQQCKSKKFFTPNTILFIEIGFDQYEYSKKYLKNLGLKCEYFKDNSGIYRCIKIYF